MVATLCLKSLRRTHHEETYISGRFARDISKASRILNFSQVPHHSGSFNGRNHLSIVSRFLFFPFLHRIYSDGIKKKERKTAKSFFLVSLIFDIFFFFARLDTGIAGISMYRAYQLTRSYRLSICLVSRVTL